MTVHAKQWAEDCGDETVNQCELCKESFASQRGLKTHMRWCPVAMKEGEDEDGGDGVKTEGDTGESNANPLPPAVAEPGQFPVPIGKRTPGHAVEGREGEEVTEKFPCDQCNLSYWRKYDLKAHKYRAHNIGDAPFRCEFCKQPFTRAVSLTKHIRRYHSNGGGGGVAMGEDGGEMASPPKANPPTEGFRGEQFECHLCSRRYNKKSDLSAHLYCAHKVGKPAFQCKYCGKAVTRSATLRDHIRKLHAKEAGLPMGAGKAAEKDQEAWAEGMEDIMFSA